MMEKDTPDAAAPTDASAASESPAEASPGAPVLSIKQGEGKKKPPPDPTMEMIGKLGEYMNQSKALPDMETVQKIIDLGKATGVEMLVVGPIQVRYR